MPYIGKSPVGGGFHKLDNLTASATATYALTLGSAAYYPETANQLLVSLNGVIQAPQDSFTVSGSNLVFDSALTASDSIDFVVALGDVLGVGSVTDGAVTTAKIANGAVTTAKIGNNAVTMNKLATSGTLPALDGSNLTGLSESNIKEQLAMLCDGEDYTVPSGTYTAQNVTAGGGTSSTHSDLSGSVVTYTPPAGTTAVVYEFSFAVSPVDTDEHNILHAKLLIAGTEVTNSRCNFAGKINLEMLCNFRYVIPIGGTANTTTGRQSSWTSGKEIKMQVRRFGTGNEPRIHETRYWDGASNNVFRRPTLTITALG
jgi:hypothetical protein